MTACQSCGAENPPSNKFCGECGARLEIAPPQETRKTVSVVFADVTGSTALAERLDAEAVRAVMTRYFDEMKAAVEAHGGTVEKFIGDAVVAVFGIPVLHEDDALRAVKAAQGMRNALARINDDLPREWDVELRARIGVNTGPVVAGGSATGESFVTGDAVNVAARLQQAAEPMQVLIGDATYQLVKHAVAVERRDELELKGKSVPVGAYSLVQVLEDAESHPRRGVGPLVGRASDMQRLDQLFAGAVEKSACVVATIIGSPGVGKSRLVEEATAALATKATILTGRCLSYGEGITFWPILEVIRQAADVRDLEEPNEANPKLRFLLEGKDLELTSGLLAEDAEASRCLRGLVGLSGEESSAEETIFSVRKLFEDLASKRPLVVVFDDIQWAERTFLDLVEYVVDRSQTSPILVICMARPELLDERPDWMSGRSNASTINLEPLPRGSAEEMVRRILGGGSVDPILIDRIVQTAEGNPLFVEEMLSILIEDGVLAKSNGGWILTDADKIVVPPNMEALLAARIDRLRGEERSVIERAAVIGQEFERVAVVGLSPPDRRDNITRNLMKLVRRELIRPIDPNAADDAYRFRHLLVRDAAYESMSKQMRGEMHRDFAAWLESRLGADTHEYEEILGYHLERAYVYAKELGRPDDSLAQRARHYLSSAGKRGLARGDSSAAASLLDRAVGLSREPDETMLVLQVLLAEARYESGEHESMDELLEDVKETATRLGLERPLHLLAVSDYVTSRDSLESARQRISEAVGRLAEIGTPEDVLKAEIALGWHEFWLGRATVAEEILWRALEKAVSISSVLLEFRAHDALLTVLPAGPASLDHAYEGVERIEQRCRPTVHLKASLLRTRSVLQALQGATESARATLEEARTLYRSHGMFPPLGGTNGDLAEILLRSHPPDQAAVLLAESFESFRAFGSLNSEPSITSTIAYLAALGGDAARAREFSERAAALTEGDDIEVHIRLHGARAILLAEEGQSEAARAEIAAGEAMAEPVDYLTLRGEFERCKARAYEILGDDGARSDALGRALELFRRKGDVISVARVEAELAS